MRTIAIADQSGILGWARDVEETIEEAVTWAEAKGLHVIGTDEMTVYVKEYVDTCDGCGTTTFITRTVNHPDRPGLYKMYCFHCTNEPHTEHYEQMMKEINR